MAYKAWHGVSLGHLLYFWLDIVTGGDRHFSLFLLALDVDMSPESRTKLWRQCASELLISTSIAAAISLFAPRPQTDT